MSYSANMGCATICSSWQTA